jgi:hypothetical protein
MSARPGPGNGNVRCEKTEGATIGVCRNPTGCDPQGNVRTWASIDNYLLRDTNVAALGVSIGYRVFL